MLVISLCLTTWVRCPPVGCTARAEETFEIFALRDIEKGEELTLRRDSDAEGRLKEQWKGGVLSGNSPGNGREKFLTEGGCHHLSLALACKILQGELAM